MSRHVVVVGAGVFGMTGALELRRRGWHVTLCDPGPIPHPLAASTDISKVIRMEYGEDADYMAWAEDACDGWLAWNERWQAPLYHETGVLMVCREPMVAGGFERESYQLLLGRGHTPVRLTSASLGARFPASNATYYTDGFFHAKGGYVESGRVVQALTAWALEDGVEVRQGTGIDRLLEAGGRIVGVVDDRGGEIRCDEVVIAAGVWTAKLAGLPAPCIQPTGHPVFHLRPQDPGLFEAERFPTFTADVSRTGFYGFPLHRDGVVKIGNHSLGTTMKPDAHRAVTSRDEFKMREFLTSTFPALADAPIVYTRLCLYADTQDENFWIARDPNREGLTVASGGSGHGFKFAPVLGPVIADAVEGVHHPFTDKFRWRADLRMERGTEAARARDIR